MQHDRLDTPPAFGSTGAMLQCVISTTTTTTTPVVRLAVRE
jgi:hypothetical protein